MINEELQHLRRDLTAVRTSLTQGQLDQALERLEHVGAVVRTLRELGSGLSEGAHAHFSHHMDHLAEEVDDLRTLVERGDVQAASECVDAILQGK